MTANGGESKDCCKPKLVLVVLVAVCFVSVLLASRSFGGIPKWAWDGFLLKGSRSRASPVSGVMPSPAKEATLAWQSRGSNVSIDPNVSPSIHTKETANTHNRREFVDFDPHGNDTLVVIHTQKTGGSEFIKHLVTMQRDGKYLCVLPSIVKASIEKRRKVPNRGKKGKRSVKRRVSCPRDPSNPEGEQWLIASKTVRWVCGLHASFSEYRNCLPALNNPQINAHRRLHYIILLRHPVMRYLSEYLHVQRNATWATSQHMCNNKPVSVAEMPPCYPGYYLGKPWVNVTLTKFASCDSNWANNRQTMMLADVEAVHCFDKTALSKDERERILLESAKENLRKFSFLGLTEYMAETCQLFEKTFSMTFAVRPEPYNSLSEFRSGPLLVNLQDNAELYAAILRRNQLDMELYQFALDLFMERAGRVGILVDRGYVAQEVKRLQDQPNVVESIIEKHKALNYKIS